MLLVSFDLSELGIASLTMRLLLIHLVSLKLPFENRLRKLLTCAIAFGSDGRDLRQSSTKEIPLHCVGDFKGETVFIIFSCFSKREVCTGR